MSYKTKTLSGGNAQSGTFDAISTEKYNHLPHEDQESFVRDIQNAKTNNERFDVIKRYYEKNLENKANDPEAAENTLTVAQIASAGQVQIVDTAGNIIAKYDKNKLPSEIGEMVFKEAAKGYGLYQLGEAAKRSGYPSSLIISTEIGIIVLSNFYDELDERK